MASGGTGGDVVVTNTRVTPSRGVDFGMFHHVTVDGGSGGGFSSGFDAAGIDRAALEQELAGFAPATPPATSQEDEIANHPDCMTPPMGHDSWASYEQSLAEAGPADRSEMRGIFYLNAARDTRNAVLGCEFGDGGG